MNLFAPLSENTKKDVLVEFKAGRMNFKKDGSKWVEPDKRKGSVQLKQSGEPAAQFVHFIWKDRTTGTEELNLMLFPHDATFRKVNEASGRVFVLEWQTSSQKLFFWMQEAKDDKDKEYCDNINKFITNPPQASAEAPLNDLGMGGLGRAQLLQLLGGNAGSLGGLSNILNMQGAGRGRGNPAAQGRPTSTQSGASNTGSKPPSSTSTSHPVQQSSDTATRPTRPAPSTAQQPPANALQLGTLQQLLSQVMHKEPSLKEIINVDEILASGLFDNPEVVAKLVEFLPEGQQVNAQNLKENIRSPQFQQAVAMFNQALRSGQLAGIMSSFGLDPSSVGPNSSIEEFLRAIQKKAKEEQKPPHSDSH